MKDGVKTGHKYFSAEKFSNHASRRRAPALRSKTLLSSPLTLQARIPHIEPKIKGI